MILGITFVFEWIVFGKVILELRESGFNEVIGFSCALLIFSILLITFGRWLNKKQHRYSVLDESLEPQNPEIQIQAG